jgi:hypothetical protein
MANTRISAAAAIAACDAIVDLIDSAASPDNADVEIRTGLPPADVDSAATGTLLATFQMPNPAFGNAVDASPGGQATANLPATVQAVATGTAGYFRVYDGAGVAVWQGNINLTAESPTADMTLNTLSIQSGADVEITSWTVTMPQQ